MIFSEFWRFSLQYTRYSDGSERSFVIHFSNSDIFYTRDYKA